MRKFFFLLVSVLFSAIMSAQVSVTASAGTPGPTAYTTVSDAFAAINAGTHQGNIAITISANTTEPTAPTALLKSAAPSSYTAISIMPLGNVTVSSAATPTTNRGIIELAGADNVTIDGDDPATPGTRNLTVSVTTSTNNTAGIRVSSNSATGTDGADNVTVKNCNVIGGRSTATTTTTGIYGINVSQYSTTSLATGAASCLNLTIENNAITRSSRGIYVLGASGFPLNGLKVKNNVLGSSTAADNIGVTGIFISHTSATAGATSAIVEGNDVRAGDVSASGTGYSASVTGIELGTVNAGAIVRGNNIHDLYQPSTAGYGAYGILVSGSASCNDILIANNFLTNIVTLKYTATSLSAFTAYGIRYSAGATLQSIINNTIVLPAATVGTLANYVNYGISFGVSGVTVSKMYNNIVVNSNVGTGTFGVYVNTTTNISGGAVDNNNYYVPSGNVGYYNAAARATLADWKSATGKDGSALGVNPTFASGTDFHLSYGTTPTQLESGGAAVATTGISTDFDGQARPGPAGSVNGGASAPDMGADEFDGVPLDLTAPSISYTPLNFTCATGARTLTATVTDASGVPTSGTGLPVLYWNINGGAYSAATATYVSGSSYSFSFGAGAVLGDVVNYYIAAQDNAPTPNVGTFPITGSAGYSANPPAAATAPTTPSSYAIANILNGIYTVGATGTYPTLTAALNAYNTNCLGGPVEFSLIDPLYSTSETFPLTINQNPDASAANTLTIRPAAGVTTSITGSVASNGLIRVLGSHVIIDGSNNGSGFQNLSIQNTNTTSPRVILAGSATTTPLINVTLKNFYALNGSKTSTSALAIQISNSVGTAGNFNNILVENISVSTSYAGIYALANVAAGNGSGLIIRNNGLDVSGATSINNVGVYVQGTDGAVITGNRIGNFDGTTGQTDNGIWLATGTVNTVIEKNTIYNLVYTGTAGYNGRGIYLSTAVANSNNLIKNNMIYNMGGDGDDFATFGNQYNPTGIYLAGTTAQTGVEISNNTIFLSGNYINGLGTYVAGIALDDNSAASIRNNIIVNTSGIAAAGTGVGPVAIAAENSIAQFTALSNNAYNIAASGTAINNIGKVGATDYATLAAFQAATSADANSKVTVPVFVSPTNLHLSTTLGDNLCLNGAATPLANVTDDFDGNTRNTTTPDMGADEFAPTLPTFVVNNQSACFGNTVNLTAGAVTTGSLAGQTFTYFTDAACTTAVTDPTAVGAGTYYIKATYTSGGCSIDQVSPVTVTINLLPATFNVTGGGAYCAGGAGLAVGLDGSASGINYQLQLNGSDVGSAVAGTGSAISFGAQTAAGTYTVVATDATTACVNTMTGSVSITIDPLPSTFAVTGGGAYCAGGTGLSVGLAGSESGINYQLQLNGSNVGSAVAGTGSAISFGAQTAAGTYTVVATNVTTSCTNNMTGSVTVSIDALPVLYTVTGGGAYCSGGVGSAVGLDNSEVGVNYQLVLDGTTNVGSPVSGTGSAISFGTITAAGVYTVVAINPTTTCTSTMTGSATLSVNALPVINYTLNQPNNCNSNNGGALLTLSGAAGPYTFNWTGAGIIQGQQDQTTLRVGSYTVVVTAANGCQATANFTLFGPGGCDVCPAIGAVATTPTAICQAGTATLSATSLADLGVSYGIDFVVSSTPLANPYTGTVVATVANGSLTGGGTAASTTYTFNTPGTQYVYAILSPAPADPGCRPFKATQISVLATPDVNAVANQTVCSGSNTAAVNFTSSVPGYTYTWTNNTTSIGLAASGTGNIPSFTATNFTNTPVTATVTVTPVNATPAFTTQTFNSTGAVQTWTVPAGVTSVNIKAWGAQGADGIFSGQTGKGGLGGYSEGVLTVTPGQQLSLYVGSAGTSSTGGIICCGGFNGGGNAMGNAVSNARGGGGGASDVRLGAATLNDRVLVAGGGGGGCVSFSNLTVPVGGAGGGLNGGDGFDGDINATGGTQIAGGTSTNPSGWENGAFGLGGSVFGPGNTISGGGGGYYGGAAGNNAGGGSGYIGGVASGVTNAGVRSGDGQIILEYGSAASATCPGPSKTFTITVNPTPTVNTVANVAACSSATVSVPFSGFVPGTTYEWTNSNTAIGLAASGTGDLSFTGTNSGSSPITGNIIVTPKYTNNSVTCTGTPVAFTITINPTPTVSAVSNEILCNGSATTAVTFSGAVTGTVYNWTNSTPSIGLAASGTGNIASFTAVNTGTAPVTATITVTPAYTSGGSTCTGTPTTYTITVNPSGQVNAVANQTICNNANTTAVTFGTANTGGTTTYSWTNDNTSIGLAASGIGDIASFVGVNAGTTPVTATITVTPTFTSGSGVQQFSGSIAAAGPNMSARMNRFTNTSTCSNITSFPGIFSTGAYPYTTYTYTNTTGTTQCISSTVTSTSGNIFMAAYSNSFDPANIATNYLADAGSSSVGGTPRTMSFNVPNGTTYVLVLHTVDPGQAGTYDLSLSGAPVACSGTPRTFTITINPTPTVNAVSNEVVCNGANTTAVTFGGAVTGTVYNWTNSTPSIGLAASGTGNIASFAAVNTGTTPVTATITVTPSYTNGGTTCTGTPTSYTITVNPTPTVNTVANQAVCNGSNTTAVTFSGAVTGTVYNWTNNTTSIGLAASGTGDIASFVGVNTGTAPVTATITVTPSFTNGGTTCTGTPRTFTITVNPTPTVNAVSNQVICNGSNTTAVSFSGAVTGTVYNWTNNTTSIGLAASGTGNIASFAAVNTGTTAVTATITVTPSYTNGGVTCTGTPTSFTITVNPTPTVTQPTNQVLCNGSNTTAVTFTGAVAGTVYNWTNNTTSIGLAASGTGNIASFVAVNAGVAPVVATITVTPSFTSGGVTCLGTPRTFTITVNPTPTVNAVSNQVVCNRSTTAAVTFSGAVTGTVYNWTNNTTSIGLAASGTGDIAAFTAVNTTQTPVVATITVTPSYTNGGVTCLGTPRTFTITVNPTPIVTATDLFNQRICISDGAVALNGAPVGGTWSGIGVSGFNFIPSATAVGNFLLTYSYTNQYGCTSIDTTTAKVSACDERNISLSNGGAVVFPNPNGGQFNIRVNSTRFKYLQMRIYNDLGQLISTKQWSGLVYRQILPVDMRHLPAAVYTVRIIYDGGNLYEDKGFQMLIQH